MYRIPNRIFVGGIPQTASQDELREYFGHFGMVKDARIITDPRGNSKGYGFVTYESENDASKVLSVKEEDLIFKESKLNIGHAFRKKNNFPGQQGGGGFQSGLGQGLNGMNLGMGQGLMGGLGGMGMNMNGLGQQMGGHMQNAIGGGGQNGGGGNQHHLQQQQSNQQSFMDQGQMSGMSQHHMQQQGNQPQGMNSMGGQGGQQQMHHQMGLQGMNAGFGGMGGLNGMNMN